MFTAKFNYIMQKLIFYGLPCFLILVVYRQYRRRKWGRCKNSVKLTGKVAIVTGANSGIGYEIAKNLALREAEVILACRNIEAARNAIKKIDADLVKSRLIPMKLDLSSLQSVQNFVDEIKKNYSHIHLLVNNAGVSYPKNTRVETEDGFEIHFGVNHLGHFLLTNLLLDLMKASAPSRIIIISSLLHEKGRIYLDDLNAEKYVRNLYANSKLMNAYFGKELAKKLCNTGVNVYTCCPGWVYTNLFRHYERKWYHYILVAPIAFFFMRSADEGAQTPLYCATEPDLNEESGYMYRDCKKYNSKLTFDETVSNKLWLTSEKLITEKLSSTDKKIK